MLQISLIDKNGENDEKSLLKLYKLSFNNIYQINTAYQPPQHSTFT